VQYVQFPDANMRHRLIKSSVCVAVSTFVRQFAYELLGLYLLNDTQKVVKLFMQNATQFLFPLDCTALWLPTFGVHFRHTGRSGITVQVYVAQAGARKKADLIRQT